jgi:hypothetical protein
VPVTRTAGTEEVVGVALAGITHTAAEPRLVSGRGKERDIGIKWCAFFQAPSLASIAMAERQFSSSSSIGKLSGKLAAGDLTIHVTHPFYKYVMIHLAHLSLNFHILYTPTHLPLFCAIPFC